MAQPDCIAGTADFREAEAPARAAALKAVELDEQLAEAHISLSNIKQQYDWDWTGAEKESLRALELDPGGVDAHLYHSYLLMHVGQLDEAIREGRIVVQLDPVSSRTWSALGRFLYRAHRYEEALAPLQRAVELEPASGSANCAWAISTCSWAGMRMPLPLMRKPQSGSRAAGTPGLPSRASTH